jgi:hypothetical protein
MRRPGDRLRTIAARVCRARTMERLIDPALADLQVEYENAVLRGRKWESRWVWISGHLAFFQAVVVHGGARTIGILDELTDEDRRTLIRTSGSSAAIIAIGTVVLAAVPFLRFLTRSDPNAARLALYVIPQALPISVPVGLTFGILWGLGGAAASRRSRTLVLIAAVTSSVASFTMLAWVAPVANQAFRVSVARHSLAKGTNELTLGELGRLLEPGARDPMTRPASHSRGLALNYHTRWALAGAPLVLSFFAVALTSRRQRGRLMPGLAGFAAIFGYYVIMSEARGFALDRTVPAFAAAWAPNAALLILSVAVMRAGSGRSGLERAGDAHLARTHTMPPDQSTGT